MQQRVAADRAAPPGRNEGRQFVRSQRRRLEIRVQFVAQVVRTYVVGQGIIAVNKSYGLWQGSSPGRVGTDVTVPPGVTGQDEGERLWDIVWMLHLAICRSRPGADRLPVGLYVRNGDIRSRLVKLVAVCGRSTSTTSSPPSP